MLQRCYPLDGANLCVICILFTTQPKAIMQLLNDAIDWSVICYIYIPYVNWSMRFDDLRITNNAAKIQQKTISASICIKKYHFL